MDNLEPFLVIVRIMKPKIEEIGGRYNNIKMGEIKKDKKKYFDNNYLDYCENKITKLSELVEAFSVQFNNWNEESRKYCNCYQPNNNDYEIKKYCEEFVNSFLIFEKEWEETIFIEPTPIFFKLNELLVESYEYMLNKIYRFFIEYFQLVDSIEILDLDEDVTVNISLNLEFPPNFEIRCHDALSEISNQIKLKKPLY